MTDKRSGGYIDQAPLARKLSAHVTNTDDRPRIHGYDVQGDLARHYSPLETGVLCLLGELLSGEQREMLEAAMSLCTPLHAGEGPCRSATLAWLTAGDGLAAVRVGWLALVDRAQNELQERTRLWDALLKDDLDALRAASKSNSELDSWLVEKFASRCPAIALKLDRISGALALLVAAGIRTREQAVLLLCMARIPTVFAEAAAGQLGGFKGYPANTPNFSEFLTEDEP